jgi:hypothetical protein
MSAYIRVDYTSVPIWTASPPFEWVSCAIVVYYGQYEEISDVTHFPGLLSKCRSYKGALAGHVVFQTSILV